MSASAVSTSSPPSRGQKLEPLTRAVDADREIDFARDRHRLLEQQRRRGIVERGGDARALLRKLGQIGQPAHQAALAAAAFQQLRLEHVARPLRRFGGRALARAAASTPRGTARPWRRSKAFPSISAKRIMRPPSPCAHPRINSDPSMPDPVIERLPFLDAEPWRVAVINPTGRYARNQVAGLDRRRHAARGRRRARPRRRDAGRVAALRPRRRSAGAAERGGALHAGRRRARRHRRCAPPRVSAPSWRSPNTCRCTTRSRPPPARAPRAAG